MAQLRQGYDQFIKRNAEVLVIGPENASAFHTYFTNNDLPFRGLPNPDHSVLNMFGQEVNLFKLGRMPAQFVINIEGVVRFIHYPSFWASTGVSGL